MKILVTGALGFIGSHLVDKLVNEGHEVFGVDDFSGSSMDNAGKAQYFIYDCRDVEKMAKLFARIKPEVVFHLAANAAEGKSHFSPIDITTRNYNAFMSVLVAGINNGMRRFVYTSSNAVYGDIPSPYKESDTPKPEDVYGLTKLCAEETLHLLSKVHGFEYTIARPHNVYGPRQNMTDPYRNVMTIWMNRIMRGEPYVVYGDGSMKRCYTYISDLIDGLYKLGFENVNGEVFNLGADEVISLKQLSDALQKVTKSAVIPEYLPVRVLEVIEAVPDHEKAKRMLNYKTKVSFLEGIRRTWNWAKEVGPQEFKYTPLEIESDKKPKNWK